ncbi:MAG: hypothetical protein ACRES7_11745 [Gammaproteobacteria bacterium]
MSLKDFPEGASFFEWLIPFENHCASTSNKRFPELDESAAKCRENLGTLLSLLYRESCCAYGCKGNSHIGERIAGRVVSHAVCSYKLLLTGYYDESLSLTRSIGELGNLLWLFVHRPRERDRWLTADNHTRIREYSPLKVRLKLEAEKLLIPIDEGKYSSLCEVAVHPTPGVSPQSHNAKGIPTLGAMYQREGCLACLNELAAAVGFGGSGVLPMLDIGERRERILKTAATLLRSIGNVDLQAVRNSTEPSN